VNREGIGGAAAPTRFYGDQQASTKEIDLLDRVRRHRERRQNSFIHELGVLDG